DHLWTIAVARLIFGPEMNIQAPPNLNPGALAEMIAAGINDWGGVSPVTPDHVNPEAPWPALDRLARETAAAGKLLVERLAIYPAYGRDVEHWVDPALRFAVLRTIDAEGLARSEDWVAGSGTEPPVETRARPVLAGVPLVSVLERAAAGKDLNEADIVQLFSARGEDFHAVCRAANELRQRVN